MRIFVRLSLKGHLSKKETDRLLRMCHFYLAQWAFVRSHSWRSFVFCPAGYNHRTNRPLAVMTCYMLPVLGPLLRKLVQILK